MPDIISRASMRKSSWSPHSTSGFASAGPAAQVAFTNREAVGVEPFAERHRVFAGHPPRFAKLRHRRSSLLARAWSGRCPRACLQRGGGIIQPRSHVDEQAVFDAQCQERLNLLNLLAERLGEFFEIWRRQARPGAICSRTFARRAT